jgi:hypothetical protein
VSLQVWLCGSIRSFVMHVVLCGEACRHVGMPLHTIQHAKHMLPHNHTLSETCWSDFKCFRVWHLNWCFITNKCISWTIIYSLLLILRSIRHHCFNNTPKVIPCIYKFQMNVDKFSSIFCYFFIVIFHL